jgi:colanic acid biosynthesis glycosyl transferase WcaI
MKILILGLNYAPEKIGIAVYTTSMAETLAAHGHKVQIIAGQPYYPAWKISEGHSRYWYSRGREKGIDVTRAPHYVPTKPSGAKRLLHHMSFAIASFFPMLWRALTFRPDLVLTVAPSLIATPGARIAALLCGAKSWLHIQDFEVEAAFATGLLKKESRVGAIAEWFENAVFRGYDAVSSISPQMCAKLREKGVAENQIYEFRNWADIQAICPLDRPSTYRAEWGIASEHVALYSGNIANKQGIEIVVKGARLLRHRKDLIFVICGEGPNREALRASAAGLDNVQFHDLQPRERLNELLNLASVHLLPQMANAADLVLPSKLVNMLASGRPVVATAAPGTGLASEVEGCGIVTPAGDAQLFANAVAQLLDNKTLYNSAREEARRRAEERWAQTIILQRLEAQITNLVAGIRGSLGDEPEAPLR